jgi:hypothetical protein
LAKHNFFATCDQLIDKEGLTGLRILKILLELTYLSEEEIWDAK